MDLTEVQAIYFDAVGTILFPNPPAAVVYAETGHRFGSQLSQETIRQRFHQAFAEEEEKDRLAGWHTSEERERLRWQNIVAKVLDDVTDPWACFQELYQHFAKPQSWRLAQGIEQNICQLHEASYHLGIASNYDHRLRSVLAGFPGLQILLPNLVISAEIGWRKPARSFFQAMSAKVKQPLNQILYVGDDPVNDIEAAKACGMLAFLVNPKQPDFNVYFQSFRPKS